MGAAGGHHAPSRLAESLIPGSMALGPAILSYVAAKTASMR